MADNSTIIDPLMRRYLERERECAVARLRELDRLLGRPPSLPNNKARHDVMQFERNRRTEGERGE